MRETYWKIIAFFEARNRKTICVQTRLDDSYDSYPREHKLAGRDSRRFQRCIIRFLNRSLKRKEKSHSQHSSQSHDRICDICLPPRIPVKEIQFNAKRWGGGRETREGGGGEREKNRIFSELKTERVRNRGAEFSRRIEYAGSDRWISRRDLLTPAFSRTNFCGRGPRPKGARGSSSRSIQRVHASLDKLHPNVGCSPVDALARS